jgi:chemotaxis signal transduction protein
MKHKRNAIAALQKDCEITGHYYDNGKTCAVGCLALIAGMPAEQVKQSINVITTVSDYFSLPVDSVSHIIALNDSVKMEEPDHIKKRQNKVIAYLETIWEDHEE